MSPNDQFLLPAISKLQASREKINMLIPISVVLFVFVFSSPFRSRVKSPNSFKKPYSVSMMSGQYGSSVGKPLGQEESTPSADEFTDTVSAQELLPERLLAQLRLEKIESRR